jgi:hypothetical protein
MLAEKAETPQTCGSEFIREDVSGFNIFSA